MDAIPPTSIHMHAENEIKTESFVWLTPVLYEHFHEVNALNYAIWRASCVTVIAYVII